MDTLSMPYSIEQDQRGGGPLNTVLSVARAAIAPGRSITLISAAALALVVLPEK
jgi:hypothetical protein